MGIGLLFARRFSYTVISLLRLAVVVTLSMAVSSCNSTSGARPSTVSLNELAVRNIADIERVSSRKSHNIRFCRSQDGSRLAVAVRAKSDKDPKSEMYVNYVSLFVDGKFKSLVVTEPYAYNYGRGYPLFSDAYEAIYGVKPPPIPDIDQTPHVISRDGRLIVQLIREGPVEVRHMEYKGRMEYRIVSPPDEPLHVLSESRNEFTRFLHCRAGGYPSMLTCFLDEDGNPCLLMQDEDSYSLRKLENDEFVQVEGAEYSKPKKLLWLEGYISFVDISPDREWISIRVDRGIGFAEFATLIQRDAGVQRKVEQQSIFYALQ